MSLAPELEACLAEAFRRLARGVTDRRSPFHTPVLATVAADGAPEARTLVLRGFEAEARILRLHSDARSAKVAALGWEARCQLHAYDPAAGLQLRLSGRAGVHAEDEVAETAWAASRDASRMCYAVEPGPGTPVATPPPAPRDPSTGRAQFRVIRLHFHRLEWLELSAEGHRRARFDWTDEGPRRATWLVP